MNVFLDNCLAPRHALSLQPLFAPEHHFEHLRDRFSPGVSDEEWLERLGLEGGWIVISGDDRIRRTPHEREAWRRSGLTVFFLAKGWMHLPLPAQHARLTLCMEDILETARRHPKGKGFVVTVRGKIEEL